MGTHDKPPSMDHKPESQITMMRLAVAISLTPRSSMTMREISCTPASKVLLSTLKALWLPASSTPRHVHSMMYPLSKSRLLDPLSSSVVLGAIGAGWYLYNVVRAFADPEMVTLSSVGADVAFQAKTAFGAAWNTTLNRRVVLLLLLHSVTL